MAARRVRAGLVVGLLMGWTASAQALTINFLNNTGDANADAGFTAAAARWEALFTDAVTVNITRGFGGLPGGVLASTGSVQADYTYANTKAALTADQTTADDATAVANLPGGAAFDLFINNTTDFPGAVGGLDNNGSANNTTVHMANANAKALGLLAPSGASDASITFGNSGFTWDFDPTNGITAGQFDFVGIAQHEIGHALGYISGVDVLDFNTGAGPNALGFSSNQFTFVSTLDLYRRSSATSVIDWRTGDTPYFSIDGGVTNLGLHATGVYNGDGRQASHWKDGLGLGLLDPTAAPGELLAATPLDVQAFDVIGWDLQQEAPPIPEPASCAVLLFGMVVALRRRRD